jgi:hypothetical protein
MDLSRDFCPRELTLEEMINRLYSPESFFKAIKGMKSVNFCTVIPDGIGAKVYYISVEDIWHLFVFVLFVAACWRLLEAAQTCVYRICCKK